LVFVLFLFLFLPPQKKIKVVSLPFRIVNFEGSKAYLFLFINFVRRLVVVLFFQMYSGNLCVFMVCFF